MTKKKEQTKSSEKKTDSPAGREHQQSSHTKASEKTTTKKSEKKTATTTAAQQKSKSAKKVTIDVGAVAQHLGMMIVVSVIVIFVGLNILSSQLVSPLYRGIVKNNDDAWVLFLKIAPELSSFETEIEPYVRGRYQEYAQALTADDLTRREKIAQLEQLLETSPDSPPVLYALSSLYAQGNDQEMADEYLERARALDPEVGTE